MEKIKTDEVETNEVETNEVEANKVKANQSSGNKGDIESVYKAYGNYEITPKGEDFCSKYEKNIKSTVVELLMLFLTIILL